MDTRGSPCTSRIGAAMASLHRAKPWQKKTRVRPMEAGRDDGGDPSKPSTMDGKGSNPGKDEELTHINKSHETPRSQLAAGSHSTPMAMSWNRCPSWSVKDSFSSAEAREDTLYRTLEQGEEEQCLDVSDDSKRLSLLQILMEDEMSFERALSPEKEAHHIAGDRARTNGSRNVNDCGKNDSMRQLPLNKSGNPQSSSFVKKTAPVLASSWARCSWGMQDSFSSTEASEEGGDNLYHILEGGKGEEKNLDISDKAKRLSLMHILKEDEESFKKTFVPRAA